MKAHKGFKDYKKLGLSKVALVKWDGREDIKPRSWKTWRSNQRK